MHGRHTSYTNTALILYSLVYLTGFLKERLIFFAQLNWSGRVYTLTAVSGLSEKMGGGLSPRLKNKKLLFRCVSKSSPIQPHLLHLSTVGKRPSNSLLV